MNLNQLEYFIALSKLGHFKKAADELCITQPSLSYAISQLETELKVTLIERKSHPLLLTPEGREFLIYAQKALATIDQGVKTMHQISQGHGLIRLGFLRTLGVTFIPELASAFLKQQKKNTVHFEFHTDMSLPLLQGLKNEHYDMVFCSEITSESLVSFTPVARQDLILAVPNDHPLAVYDKISLEDTLSYPHIFFTPDTGLRYVIDQMFQTIQNFPPIAYETEEDQVIAGLVAQKFGIAVLPHMEILHRLPLKILQISHPHQERYLYMATLKNRHLSPPVQNFQRFVLEQNFGAPL